MQFKHEFRSRSLAGVIALTMSILVVVVVARTDLPTGFQVTAYVLFGFIAICSTFGILTDHRVGSSVDGEYFRWWSKRGFLPFARSVPLSQIRSAEFINGRGRSDRTFLRLELKNGRTIKVSTFFFLDGKKLLEVLRAASPEITTRCRGANAA